MASRRIDGGAQAFAQLLARGYELVYLETPTVGVYANVYGAAHQGGAPDGPCGATARELADLDLSNLFRDHPAKRENVRRVRETWPARCVHGRHEGSRFKGHG